MILRDATWSGASAVRTVVVPVGALEQHGPHLPLDTDAVIAEAVAARVAGHLEACLAPVVAYGASGEHQAFAGTLSIGTEALTSVLVELARSATTWADRVVLVNGHGGNLEAVHRAATLLRREGREIAWAPCAPRRPGDAHAGRTETSVMLHLDPARVKVEAAEPGCLAPLADLLPELRAGGVAAVSPNGVLGDPSGATAEEGAQILEEMVAGVLGRLGAHVG
ncbi:mycofactocin biosynthesis peptidyl-dipeptidase MftE [Nocardioides insulae]|uniref:mycofactocin biosynthesis peptidyl-dipeptidase MftE n=1 Tax=Nocardioides insulae TaxID=394734 RepID=UPI000400B8A2|nr:mycofactocin biosynthesis peptidyl-dipeptidase MftE [Nocardioides insulae]